MNKLEWYEKVADLILCNLEDFYSNFYNEYDLVKVGNIFRLEPCPMCGHKNCCTIGTENSIFCFSCEWSGTHINAWFDYAIKILNMSMIAAIQKLENFANLRFPADTKQDVEEFARHKKNQEILSISERFYHNQLIETKEKFNYEGQEVTPLQYMTNTRKRQLETLKSFRCGFSHQFSKLRISLKEAGYTDEEIKNAGVWVPEGLFVFFYKNPINKDITRINTKNPFKITYRSLDEDGNENIGDVIQGFSVGEKSFLYSPTFSYKKPFAVVEGEHDIMATIENGCNNVVCIGGNISEETILSELSKTPDDIDIYLFFDNDAKGFKYLETFNKLFPEKKLKSINFPEQFKDPDEYFISTEVEKMTWNKLTSSSELLSTEEFKIFHEQNLWTIKNRYKKLTFYITSKNDKNQFLGQVNLFDFDGKLIEREDNVPLSKCKVKMKPMNFFLSDAIEFYFNNNLEEKTLEELISIHYYSSRKMDIISIIAERIFKMNNEKRESTITFIRNKLKNTDSLNIIDNILKEVNDLQNKAMANTNKIPTKMRICQHFDASEDKAYFYFTYVKDDGDAQRKLPFLLRNDGGLIRLDLLKRKDPQCMLLIDNKYELPLEVPSALLELIDCSLSQNVVEKFINNEISEEELSPRLLAKTIEKYFRKFYYFENEDNYKVMALYCLMTYYYTLFGKAPYLYLNGEKSSGKSTLDSLLRMFCFNAKMSVGMSDASLFRMSAYEGGTIILDEMENLTSRQKSQESVTASILKGGYLKDSFIYRFNKETGNNEAFDTFCPKIISNIFGLEDVTFDRCILIKTYRLKNIVENADMLKISPRDYYSDNIDEIKEVTSRCCISAMKCFQEVKRIRDDTLFVTEGARLSQILSPLLVIAKLIDSEEKQEFITKNHINNGLDFEGEYELALMRFYKSNIVIDKRELEEATMEGNIKKIIPSIASELLKIVPPNKTEFINYNEHKFKEPIEYNIEEGWFDVTSLHVKCYMEEFFPGETIFTRLIPKWLKNIYKFNESDIKRKVVTIENEELSKEFKGNLKPKVYSYRFYFKDFINTEEPFVKNEKNFKEIKDDTGVEEKGIQN